MCGVMASADTAATNFWIGGNSAGGGWNTAGNWSAGVPTAGQVIAFRNGDSVSITADDLATALAVGGIDIDGEGTSLHLQQDATAVNTYPAINLGAGSILYVQRDKDTKLKQLCGAGMVTNDMSTSRTLFIGTKGSRLVSDFSGRIGGAIAIYVNSFARFTGTESTATGLFVVYRDKNTEDGAPVFGTAEIVKFGSMGETSSSIGKPFSSLNNPSISIRYSGWLTYIGEGETTDRFLNFRYQQQGEHGYPNTLDAGAHGDLRFTGMFSSTHEGDRSFTIALTGSNAVPCVVACPWSEGGNGTGFIFKRGTGTWRFADTAGRNNRNAFAVEEGTLQFDSIAETNVVCSLGLATMLQKPYIGAYNEANNVDWAYLLGGSTTNVVFEYTGSNYCWTTTRPIALKGSGAWLRSSSPNSKGGFSLSGVSAQAEGEDVKTLWLDGTNTHSCVGEIADGAGKVGVTKMGAGTWTLVGNQTFTGPLSVKEGTLNVARKMNYKWYRFTVKGIIFPTTNKDIFYINEVGLFNSDGERQNTGLTAVLPGTGRIKSTLDYMTLDYGQALIATSNEMYYWAENYRNLNGLFDGTGSGKYWRTANYGFTPSWNNEATHIPVVMRLPADADEVTSCDVVLESATQSLTAFSVDGSVDGVVWKNLLNKKEADGDFDHTTPNSKWLSDNSAYPTVGDTHIPAESWRFVGHEGGDDCSSLTNVSAIAVAPGATLRATGDLPVTLHCLTLDAVNGNGTVDGFDFAEDGFVDVVGMASGVPQCDVAITLANLPDGALARLNGWSVRLNGVPRSKASVKFDGTKAIVRRPGTMISLR